MISGRIVNIYDGNFVQHNQLVNLTKEGMFQLPYHLVPHQPRSGQRLLAEAASPNASHNSGHLSDPPKCHPNTRVAVQNKIKNWIQRKEDVDSPIMWLYGGAGAGKSTIARTIAEWCEEERILLSSFFFWRSDPTRNHIKSFLATIAYDITQFVPETRQLIEVAVEENRHIFSRNLESQFIKLVYEPFMKVSQTVTTPSHLPYVIIVDGLDECSKPEEQEALLRLFAFIFEHFRWRILVASRKEQTISIMFDDKILSRTTTLLALNDDYAPGDDIRRFLKDNIAEIKLKHPLKQYFPSNWPSQADIEELVEKSSGHFIFADIVIRYIQSPRRNPPVRLKLVMNSGSPGSSVVHELPFAELDHLYTHIFSSIEEDKARRLAPRLVALIILISRQMHPSYFGDFTTIATCGYALGIVDEEVKLILEELGSIVEPEDFGFYRVLHASLEDFLFDRNRSRHIWVDRNLVWIDMLRYTLRVQHSLEVLESCTNDLLGKIRLTKASYSHFVEAIDFGSLSLTQYSSHSSLKVKSALDKSCDLFCHYLNFLNTEVTVANNLVTSAPRNHVDYFFQHLDSGKRYGHQVSTIYRWLTKHYPRITWGCLLHLITNTSPISCFRIYSSGSWSNNVAFRDCLLYGFQVPPDNHTFERVSTLLAQYVGIDGLLTKKQQITSVTLHLIRYLGIKGQLDEGASLYINWSSESRRRRRSTPWLWKVRTYRRRACNLMMEPLDEMYEVSWDRLNHPAFGTWKFYRGYFAKPQNIHIGTQLLVFCNTTKSALKALPKMLYHSPKSPELTSLLSSGFVFHRIAFFFPKELRAAKLAIDRYLTHNVPLPSRS